MKSVREGKLVKDVHVKGTPRSNVRAKELKGKLLVFVSDYSTYKPVETKVEVTVPASSKSRRLMSIRTVIK